ncbi:MAG: pyridoxamine 5'-phosphate oxidase family protein, partial [Candidatus Dadabacteria bacterium]
MTRQELMERFNRPTRMGTLSTSDGQGNLNA